MEGKAKLLSKVNKKLDEKTKGFKVFNKKVVT